MGTQEDVYEDVYLQLVGVAKCQKLEFKIVKWIKKMKAVRTLEHYETVRHDEIDYDIATLKKIKNIMVSEKSKKLYILLHGMNYVGLKNKHTQSNIISRIHLFIKHMEDGLERHTMNKLKWITMEDEGEWNEG